jgi:hypothetical protein
MNNRVFNLHNRLLEYKKLSADLDALDAKRAWHGEDYKNKIFHGAHLLNLLFLAANSCSIDGNLMDSKYRKKIEQLQQQREQCNRQSFHYGGADVWIAARCVRELLHGYKNIGIELEKDIPDLKLLPPAQNIAALNIALGYRNPPIGHGPNSEHLKGNAGIPYKNSSGNNRYIPGNVTSIIGSYLSGLPGNTIHKQHNTARGTIRLPPSAISRPGHPNVRQNLAPAPAPPLLVNCPMSEAECADCGGSYFEGICYNVPQECCDRARTNKKSRTNTKSRRSRTRKN